jgi:glycosyltransferase involved in cell wall biosynthesis
MKSVSETYKWADLTEESLEFETITLKDGSVFPNSEKIQKKQTLSALICNYNHAHFLPDAIEAILGQTRLPDEILLMDDGSSDNSWEIMQSYAARDQRIQIFRKEKNEGYIPGINELTERATGDFIHRGASDDAMRPRFVEFMMHGAERRPDVGIVSSVLLNRKEDETRVTAVGIPVFDTGYVTPESVLKDYMEKSDANTTLSASTIFRRDVVNELGGWPVDLGIWDVSYILQAAALKYGMYYVDAPLYTWVDREQGLTRRDNSDLLKSLAVCARYFERMAAKENGLLFGDFFPIYWVNTVSSVLARNYVFSQVDYDSTIEYMRSIMGEKKE